MGDAHWLMYPVGDRGGEEDLCHVRSGGRWLMYPVGDGGGEEDLCHVRSGGHSVADVPSGGWGRRGGSLPCTQWGRGGGEEDLCHVRSAMYAVGWLMYPVGDGGGEEDLCHVRSGGHSVADVPSGGWERKGGSLPCTQLLSDTCTQWGMGEERRISAMYAVYVQWLMQWGMGDMYAVGDAQWLMYPVGGRSVADVPSGGWERRGGSLPCTQWGTLSDTCTQWGMGEERRISAMYAVGDTQWLMYPVGDGRGKEDLCHVRSGGLSG